MAKQQVKINWLENMAFSAEVNGHKIILDATENVGGENRGPRPKPLMLTALAGCTGMDVVSILKKMRVDVDGFNVYVEGDLTEEHPKQFTQMHVIYEFKGKNLPVEKIQKAVTLSEERYCGVSAMYRKAIGLTSEIRIIEN
ncbi:OsmC family peroxiredoxin [Mariniphaga sediminis]|jgi:putative redox protein|uniref:OsmC family peroxiredoxin n=1 Tax=Mariniphaga sediminis TaxID=1628158 RepID=A0A399CXW6_9BACT|nr:OsmC family protein [Mariniphaga sediminis]RIH64056.1 OsmC family peroxiredoxin [Mariniphaga sediminis]